MTMPTSITPSISMPRSEEPPSIDYAQGLSAIVLIIVQAVRSLLLFLLLAVAFVLWAWGLSFQTGRLFRRWMTLEKPDVGEALYKLGEIVAFPFAYASQWSQQKVKEYWGIELPQLPTLPPTDCKSLLSSFAEKEQDT